MIAVLSGIVSGGVAYSVVSSGYPWFDLPKHLKEYKGSAPPAEAEREWSRLTVINDSISFGIVGGIVSSLLGLLGGGCSAPGKTSRIKRVAAGVLFGVSLGFVLGAVGGWFAHFVRSQSWATGGEQISPMLPFLIGFFTIGGVSLGAGVTLGLVNGFSRRLVSWMITALVVTIIFAGAYPVVIGILNPAISTENVFTLEPSEQATLIFHATTCVTVGLFLFPYLRENLFRSRNG